MGTKQNVLTKYFNPIFRVVSKKKILPVGNKRTELPQNKAFPGIGP